MNDKFHLVRAVFVFAGLAITSPACGPAGERGHKEAAAPADVQRSEAQYSLPPVTLLNQNGQKMDIGEALDDGRPVLLNFIYTSCPTVCSVTTQIFSQVQARLGALDKLHMVSVTLDPEHDTPKRLLAYAHANSAGPQWDFYTGSLDDSIAVQKAFDAYRGDKMNHTPLTLMRAAPGMPWVRLDGFASPVRIVKEYQTMIK